MFEVSSTVTSRWWLSLFLVGVVATAASMAVTTAPVASAILQDDAVGVDVVNAVVEALASRCMFAFSRLFLPRVAYVMSRYGLDLLTSPRGINGGIWQISEEMLSATQNCSSSIISSQCDAILGEFAIDWPQVTWPDMRKPLYSGLALSLHTKVQLNGQALPDDVWGQADIWASAFGGRPADFVTDVASITISGCPPKMDLVFIVDTSNSIPYPVLPSIRNLTVDIVGALPVSPTDVQVAAIAYSSVAKVQFDLDDHSDKGAVEQALRQTERLNGGTLTSAALRQASVMLYDTASGARRDARKVAVLITDGFSEHPQPVAETLTDLETTVFTVEVDTMVTAAQELSRLASKPTCAHAFRLSDLHDVTPLTTTLLTGTCIATSDGSTTTEGPATPITEEFSTIDEQTTATEESTTTEEPTTATEESTTTEGSTTATEESTTTEGPTTATEESTTAIKESTTTEESTTVTEESTMAIDKSTTTEGSTTTTEQSTTVVEESTTTEGPTTATEQSTTAIAESPTTEGSTTAIEESTTTIEESTTTERPTIATEQSTTSIEESSTDLQESTTIDGSTTAIEESTTATEQSTTAIEESTTTEGSTTAIEESTTAIEESTTTEGSTTAIEKSTTAIEESTTATEQSTTAIEESTTTEGSTTATEESTTAIEDSTTTEGPTTSNDTYGCGNSSYLRVPLPEVFDSPCSLQSVAAQQSLFEYFHEVFYVQCDEQGRAWLRMCTGATRWSQQSLACL